MEVKFVMPEVWEIDGKDYKVSLSEGDVVAITASGKVIRNNRRKLIFEPIEPLIKEQ